MPDLRVRQRNCHVRRGDLRGHARLRQPRNPRRRMLPYLHRRYICHITTHPLADMLVLCRPLADFALYLRWEILKASEVSFLGWPSCWKGAQSGRAQLRICFHTLDCDYVWNDQYLAVMRS